METGGCDEIKEKKKEVGGPRKRNGRNSKKEEEK